MKYHTKEEIRNMLLVSNLAVEKGLIAIFDRQTADEQRIEDAKYHNKVGFSAAHAKRGTYYAKWVLSGKKLSGPHIIMGRNLIIHYVRQLTEIANEKMKRKNPEEQIKQECEMEMQANGIHPCAQDGCNQPTYRRDSAFCRPCDDGWERDAEMDAFNDTFNNGYGT